MSKFLQEKKFLLQKANYKKALCLTDLGIQDNVIFAEQCLDSQSKKASISSTNGIIKFLDKNGGIDLVETGTIKIINIDVLKSLLERCNLIAEIEITPTFLKLPYRFSTFLSNNAKIQYLSSLINKNIQYYVKNKKIICYIH